MDKGKARPRKKFGATIQLVLADGMAVPTHQADVAGDIPFAFNGATLDLRRVAAVWKDLAAVTVTTITTVWTPASGKKIRLMGGTISASAAGSVLFEDNAGGATIFRTPALVINTPYNFDLGNGRLLAAVNNVLKATLSVAGAITGTLYGTEE